MCPSEFSESQREPILREKAPMSNRLPPADTFGVAFDCSACRPLTVSLFPLVRHDGTPSASTENFDGHTTAGGAVQSFAVMYVQSMEEWRQCLLTADSSPSCPKRAGRQCPAATPCGAGVPPLLLAGDRTAVSCRRVQNFEPHPLSSLHHVTDEAWCYNPAHCHNGRATDGLYDRYKEGTRG